MTEELSHVPGRLAVEDSSSVIIHPDGNESESLLNNGTLVMDSWKKHLKKRLAFSLPPHFQISFSPREGLGPSLFLPVGKSFVR